MSEPVLIQWDGSVAVFGAPEIRKFTGEIRAEEFSRGIEATFEEIATLLETAAAGLDRHSDLSLGVSLVRRTSGRL